jgi:hypothetical protein
MGRERVKGHKREEGKEEGEGGRKEERISGFDYTGS